MKNINKGVLEVIGLSGGLGRLLWNAKSARIFFCASMTMLSSAALADPVGGYFMTAPGVGGARNRMCIRGGNNGEFAVRIATAYCPDSASECYNVRVDDIEFKSKLTAGHLRYVGNARCEIDIKISKGGTHAVIRQRPECRDLDPDFNSDGVYELVRRKVESEDCKI
ncbi:hypothetical protein MAFF211271_06820 [Ralstonia syzygii subsp. indonesiensis]|nr:hypothetical protein MAFF211271_06820 [Ralstonia pseudosolanacearum]